MTIESVPRPVRLQSLQALRAIAAFLVVFFHAAEIWRDLAGTDGFVGVWDRGWAGVDLFFVISGFVMVWVAGDRAPGLRTSGRFLFDRATRIYPLWWVFCSLMALYFLISYGQPAAPVRESTSEAWPHFLASLALWPQGTMPVLGVGWTLTYELAFYALFAVLLLFPASWRGWAIGGWGVALLLIALIGPVQGFFPSSWGAVLVNTLCLEFVFGALVAYMVRRFSLSAMFGRMIAVSGVALFAGFVIAALGVKAMFGLDEEAVTLLRVPLAGISSALILLGFVVWERAGRLSVPDMLNHLGDASYTLYLSHFLVLLTLKRLFEPLGLFAQANYLSLFGFMAVGAIVSIIASLILYRLIERPLLRLSRAPLAKRAQAGQS